MRILFYTRGVEQLGVEYLMSYLEQHGHEVELLFDPGLDNNLYYKVGPAKFLNRYGRRIAKSVAWKPDLVAFSCITNIFPFAIDMAKRLKKHLDVPFVFGGIHPTALPDYVFQHPEVDYVIRGEGEEALLELVDTLSAGGEISAIRNLCFRDSKGVQINSMRPLMCDLDRLPFPKKDLFFREGAFKHQLHMITGRGCPFKCNYCVNSFYRKKLYKEFTEPVPAVRRRSPANVMAEVKAYIDTYPVQHIIFMDEVFILDKPWLYEFLDMWQRDIHGISFSFSYHHRFVDRESAQRLAAAGATFAQGAIETANPDLRLQILGRRETDHEILSAMDMLREAGIRVATSAIFGFPRETAAHRWETVELVERSNPDIINTYLLYPFPGTEIAEIALREGFLSEENWELVKQGASSYHQKSLLQNIDIDSAATMAKLLPLYIKGPRVLKPLVRRLMRCRLPRLAHFLYIATVPIVYSGFARGWILNLFNMFSQSLFGKKK